MAKRDVSKLIPVKRMVTRGGKTYETTVYVSQKQAENSKNTPININLQLLRELNSEKDLREVLRFIATQDAVTKEVLRNEIVDFMERSGVKWEKHEDKAINWMRCMMKVKRKINLGEFVPEGGDKEKVVKPYKELSKDEARLVIKEFRKGKSKAEIHKAIKDAGITWKHCDHEGINHMRAMMALREHLEDGNGFTPEVNKMLSENPEYLDKLKKEEERNKEAKGDTGTDLETLYKSATPIQRKLASLTGIFCKDDNAVEYMKKAIELGHIPFDVALNSAASIDKFKFPKYIKDMFSSRASGALEDLFKGQKTSHWDFTYIPDNFFIRFLQNKGFTDLAGQALKYKEVKEKLQAEHSACFSARDFSDKIGYHYIVYQLKKYEMAGMLTLSTDKTCRDFIKEITSNIYDFAGMTDDEFEEVFNSLGGNHFLRNHKNFGAGELLDPATPMQFLHSLCVSHASVTDHDFLNLMLAAGGKTSEDSYFQAMVSYNNMVSPMTSKQLMETYLKALKVLEVTKDYNFRSLSTYKPIDMAFTRVSNPHYYPDKGNFLESMISEQQIHAKKNNISDDNLIHKFDLDRVLLSATEGVMLHNDTFNTDEFKYLSNNFVLYSHLTRNTHTLTQMKQIQDAFIPMNKEDWEQIKDEPESLSQYARFHVYFMRAKGKKKQGSIRKEINDFLLSGGKGTREYNIKLALDNNFDEMDDIPWENLNEKGYSGIKSSIETVDITSSEGKEIAKVFKESDKDNTAHDSFKTKIHNVFKISNLQNDYVDSHAKLTAEKGNTKKLFHGTDQRGGQLIMGETGRWKIFKDNSLGNYTGSMLGAGVYLAKNAKKASQYMDKEGSSGFSRRYGSRGIIFYGQAVLGKIAETRIRSSRHNQKLMDKPETDCVAMYKKSGRVLNDEWAVKTPEQFLPEYWLDVEIVSPGTKDSDTVH